MDDRNAMFSLTQVQYRYPGAGVLSFPNWQASQGEACLLIGPSGSGKTTLMNLLAGALRPSHGQIELAGTAIESLGQRALDRFRGRHIGVVPQRLHLLASLTLAENLHLAQYLAGLPQDKQRLTRITDQLGLSALLARKPAQLSQGQAQRAAIARAVINQPNIILADEPTANLDDAHCAAVIDLLQGQAAEHGATLVIATHDLRVKERIARHLQLEVQA